MSKMEIKLDDLKKAVGYFSPFLSKDGASFAKFNVQKGNLYMSVYTTGEEMTVKFPVIQGTTEDIEGVVFGLGLGFIINFLKTCPDTNTVRIRLLDNSVLLKASSCQISVARVDPSVMPNPKQPEVVDEDMLVIEKSRMMDILTKLSASTNTNDESFMQAVHFKRPKSSSIKVPLVIQSTTSIIGSMTTVSCEKGFYNCGISARSWLVIRRLLEHTDKIKIVQIGSRLLIRTEEARYIVSSMVETFPQFEDALTSTAPTEHWTFDREALISMIDRIMLISTSARFETKERQEVITVLAEEGTASMCETISVKRTGQLAMTVAIGVDQLRRLLSAHTGNEVTLSIESPDKLILFSCDKDYRCALMPRLR